MTGWPRQRGRSVTMGVSMARAERGQALVLGLFVLFMGTISLFFLFSTGQVAADKQRVTNTADAAAYSAALWRARVLNYDAYSNRAMIANEVAIAQSLTLSSEYQFNKNLAACLAEEEGDADTTCDADLATIAQFIPYWTQILAAVHYVLSIGQPIITNMVAGEVALRSQTLNRQLSLSQVPFHLSANFLLLDGVVDQVANMNDRNFRSTVLPDNFGGFTQRYTGEDRSRLANIVRNQLDPYTRGRNWTLPLGLCVAPVVAFGYTYRKRGATVLSDSLDQWEAIDNASEWRHSLRKGRCRERESPMAWADRNADDESDPAPPRTRDNPDAFDLSRESQHTARYAGIQPFYDLAYEALDDDDAAVRNPRSRVAVAVSLPGADVRTANQLNVGVGRLRLTEDFERNRITSVGAAEIYFQVPADQQRPNSGGSRVVELPSLFNPYWQARLVEPTLAQRVAARAM
jgi:Flp pilus assembly protein TadG